MRPDLDEIRRVVFELSEKAIQKFSEENKGKVFCAFGIDLNAEYAGILLCINTKEYFEKESLSLRERGGTEADIKELMKWSYGDWEYQGFNFDYLDWENTWEKTYVSKIQGYLHDPRLCSDEDYELFLADFIETCTLVLLDLEKKDVFKCLDQEQGFEISIADHDESVDISEARFTKIRNEYSV